MQMVKKFMEDLLAVNCAYLHQPEARDNTTTEMKCYSKVCMLNQDEQVAADIQKNGCNIYTKDFVKKVIDNKKNDDIP